MNPNQAYFSNGATGDFYQCAVGTTAGQTPLTTPGSWRKVQIPAKWRQALSRLTYANLLKLDGQNDKAAEERQEAYTMERVGVEDLVREEATRESDIERTSVQTNGNKW